ncbi:L-type lectin-domain containing receptor kinase S.4-like [Lycium barbarum]|uniref:L-type lectin-domain containing receptor kinase S.4-like n=1 Tax=Lycium barbarum TaxID=112863 RepID=UPI00293E06D7|nr:L-type lectin-domain containing receptor kinase S.4-like [Lycium barbarum]
MLHNLALLLLLTLLPFSIELSFSQFDPNLGLVGDAKITKNGSFVQLTDPSKSSPSTGFLFQKIPFTFLDSTSFSTDFSFSNSDDLSLVIVPKKWGFLDVDLDTFTNHVVVNVGSLVSRNKNLGLNSSGKKFQSWVDYDCTSKRLEVRVSELGGARPYGPLLVYNVDLGNMWKGQQVLVGLTSNGSSLEGTSVYSWKFSVRSVPKWLHSQPVDPNKMANRKRFRLFSSCLIFVTGCLALASLVGLFLWVTFGINNNTEVVIPAKRDFRYEKVVNVVVEEDGSGHVKN